MSWFFKSKPQQPDQARSAATQTVTRATSTALTSKQLKLLVTLASVASDDGLSADFELTESYETGATADDCDQY